ncbi:MAG: tryptophan 7-halogenase [Thalassotalea sp.]|nr:tryptophan 7-halogenase [Thalassotalea sp.]
MQTQQIRNIVIVGGGSAGWLVANHLATKLPLSNSGINITLIESPDIPTIGVGEGTVPMMRQSLKHFGIAEAELIQRCDATFKQGIKFVDWHTNPTPKESYYHHIFDYPNINNIDLTPYWLSQSAPSRSSFVDSVSLQGKVCDANLAPKLITTSEYQGVTEYAYHLDAGKFAQLLQENATQKLDVQHVMANVVSINSHSNGHIKSVTTDCCGEFNGDLFIDCSGFKSLLLGDHLGVGFIDKKHQLFTDTALAVQVPYANEHDEIPSYTKSTALQSGWIWDIGLQSRRGTGYVYSSAHTNDEQAEKDFRHYLGPETDHLAIRKIDMRIGYREKFWDKNCVAIGLSQGFVEPLEATGLLMFDMAAKMLAEQFPTVQAEVPLIAAKFNKRMQISWDSVIEFIKLHYCLSKRTDSDFWHDNRQASSIPENLKQRLLGWQYQPPQSYDFESRYEIFNLENYLYVLYGMQFETHPDNFKHQLNKHNCANKRFAEIKQITTVALDKLPAHRELINKINKFGLSKV